MSYRFKITIWCFLLSFNLSILAQQVNTPPNRWLLRAEALTGEIVGDASLLSRFDRALMYARLAEIWWKSDQERARTWMQKAIVEVESAPDQEDAQEHSRRLSTARALFTIVSSRDKKLSDRLMAIFSSDTVGRVNKDDRRKNADALVDVALSILDSNPLRAAELGLASLRVGVSYHFSTLILRLHKVDPKLSGALFNEGLTLARATNDEELLQVLAAAAFPHKLFFPPFSAPVLPENMRVAVLNLFIENLLSPPSSAEDAVARCRFSWTAAKLIDQYLALLPQFAGAMRQGVERCQASLNPMAKQHLSDDMRDQQLKTTDDYLQAAKDASDAKMRATYLGRGAYTAFSEGMPDRAIDIIESMSAAEREILPEGLWNNWRWLFAASAALKHYKSDDQYRMQKVIDAVPANLRGFTLINLIDELVNIKKDTAAREFLDDARKSLAKTDVATPERENFYLTLARLYAVLMPSDGPSVLGEAIKAVNQTDQQRLRDKTEKDNQGTVFEPWREINLPSGLLELDDAGVRYMVASIESPLRRAQARLGLLGSSVEKFRLAPSSEQTLKPAKRAPTTTTTKQ